jgi:hypothetical protein
MRTRWTSEETNMVAQKMLALMDSKWISIDRVELDKLAIAAQEGVLPSYRRKTEYQELYTLFRNPETAFNRQLCALAAAKGFRIDFENKKILRNAAPKIATPEPVIADDPKVKVVDQLLEITKLLKDAPFSPTGRTTWVDNFCNRFTSMVSEATDELRQLNTRTTQIGLVLGGDRRFISDELFAEISADYADSIQLTRASAELLVLDDKLFTADYVFIDVAIMSPKWVEKLSLIATGKVLTYHNTTELQEHLYEHFAG